MITQPGAMSLADAEAVICHDYVNGVPSPALIHAAWRAIAEVKRLESVTHAQHAELLHLRARNPS